MLPRDTKGKADIHPPVHDNVTSVAQDRAFKLAQPKGVTRSFVHTSALHRGLCGGDSAGRHVPHDYVCGQRSLGN